MVAILLGEVVGSVLELASLAEMVVVEALGQYLYEIVTVVAVVVAKLCRRGLHD